MAKHVYLVFSAPKEGREEEYNRWYDEQHSPDVLRVPGFKAARRFRLSQTFASSPNAPAYAAVYEIEADDPAAAIADLRSRLGTPAMPVTDTSDRSQSAAWLYDLILAEGFEV